MVCCIPDGDIELIKLVKRRKIVYKKRRKEVKSKRLYFQSGDRLKGIFTVRKDQCLEFKLHEASDFVYCSIHSSKNIARHLVDTNKNFQLIE